MKVEMSRRELLFGVGGVVVAGSIAAALTSQGGDPHPSPRPGEVRPCCAPAEFEGWLVTVQDKETLLAMA